jgi:two-component system KDP operon response regulator KdpE
VSVGNKPVTLTPTEYRLLSVLARNAGMTLTHDQIAAEVWGPEYVGASELIRSMIRNLRHKLGDKGRSPKYILTLPGVGYSLSN